MTTVQEAMSKIATEMKDYDDDLQQWFAMEGIDYSDVLAALETTGLPLTSYAPFVVGLQVGCRLGREA